MKRLKQSVAVILSLLMAFSLFAMPLPTVNAETGDAHRYEGEDTTYRSTNAPDSGVSNNTDTANTGTPSGGYYTNFQGGGVGEYVSYTVSDLSAGLYHLTWKTRAFSSSNATIQVSVNGSDVGRPVTTSPAALGGATDRTLVLIDTGDVHLNDGTNTVTFTVTEKGTSDRITIDYFELTELAGYTPVYTITGVPTANFITENFTLPTTVYDSANSQDCNITWASSSDCISISDGAATVTRPQADTSVTLTATVATATGDQTQSFKICVLGTNPATVSVGTTDTAFNLLDLFTSGVYVSGGNSPKTQSASDQGVAVNHSFVKVVASGTGSTISFPVYVTDAGNYDLSLVYRQHTSCGKFQVSVNDANLGSVVDASTVSGGNTDNRNAQTTIGTVALNAGRNMVTFTVTEVGASSGYNMDLYDVHLVKNVPASADYTDVTAALAEIPANYATLYTADTVSALDAVVNGIDYDLTVDDQTMVDGYASAIRSAIAALVYKDADYSAVTTAIARMPASGNDYTADSYAAARNAVSAVVYELKINEQSTVDGYAAAINSAIDGLIYKVVEMSINISEGMVTEAATEGKYNITWNATISVGGDTSVEAINASGIQFKEYGVYYATSAETLNDYANASADEIRQKVFGSSDDLTVYSMFGFRLKNINGNKTRAAMFYLEYEYNGHTYIVLSTTSETVTVLAD